MLEYFKNYFNRHPLLEYQDIYKFIHQSVFGAFHLGCHREKLAKCLNNDWNKINQNNKERTIELLNDSPCIVRVNLVPFKSEGGDYNKLKEVFLKSIDNIIGDQKEFVTRVYAVNDFLKSIKRYELSDKLLEIVVKNNNLRDVIFHHSHAYRKEYNPSYRVLVFTGPKDFEKNL